VVQSRCSSDPRRGSDHVLDAQVDVGHLLGVELARRHLDGRWLEGRAAGTGTDVVRGGFGNDVVNTADGVRDRVNCGPGRDRLVADRIDTAAGCEARTNR
jgi:hypothetical protein